jgi:hypothetical protein
LVGDWAAKKNSNHGRILACQFSVFMGIPFSLLVMKGLPHNGDSGTVAMHAVSLFVFGLMHVWAAPACNNPMFAEIVPPELRNLVYAFDRYGAIILLILLCTFVAGVYVHRRWSDVVHVTYIAQWFWPLT